MLGRDDQGEFNSLPAGPVKSMNFRAGQVTHNSAPSNRPNDHPKERRRPKDQRLCQSNSPSIRLSVPHDCRLDLLNGPNCTRPRVYPTSGRPRAQLPRFVCSGCDEPAVRPQQRVSSVGSAVTDMSADRDGGRLSTCQDLRGEFLDSHDQKQTLMIDTGRAF